MNMNKLIDKLPLLAFVLAAVGTLAFTSPNDPGPEYGREGTIWIDVTPLTPGVDYDCNDAEQVCTRSAPDNNAPMVKEGIFDLY